MGFTEGFMGLLLIVIVLAVFIPITQELLPTMIGDMGAMTGVMISSTVVVIIASALFVFMKQAMNRDGHADLQGSI